MTNTEDATHFPLPETQMMAVQRRGHYVRTGHELEGYVVHTSGQGTPEDGAIFTTVLTCCESS